MNSRRLSSFRTVLFLLLVVCVLFIPSSTAEDTAYIYSFDTQIVPNATISLLKQDETLFRDWITDQLGSYDLDQIKTYLQYRWSSLPNGYVFYIQVQKHPFDRTWKLQKVDATHVKVNDGNTYTTSTVWTYLKNNLRLTEPAGLGYASRTGVTVSSTDSGVRVDGSGDDAKVFIPGDIHYRYTVQHVNDSGNITDEFVVYPQLIDSDYYVVFDVDQWSYYTVDGSLIEVGITDIRLVGDTVQITGDGYDRLVLQADYDNNKLEYWNQKCNEIPLYYVGNNPWYIKYSYGGHKLNPVSRYHLNSGTSFIFHTGDYWGSDLNWGTTGMYSRNYWVHDTANNYYQHQLYLDSDHTSSQDVVIETHTPDNIDYIIIEMWNGTAGVYQEVLNDSTYTSANLIHLNNSSTGLDFAFYESGQRGDTVSAIYGNTSKSDVTYSNYYGCIERRAIKITLPADDGADSATSGASQVKLRLTVYYNPEGIVDNSEYTNHGTQHGGVSRVRGDDEGINSDGVDDYISIGNDDSINLSDTFTIEFDGTINKWDDFDAVWGKASDTTSTDRIQLFLWSDNTICGYLRAGNVATAAIQTDVIIGGERNHIIVTMNNTAQEFKIYQNGVLKDEDNSFTLPNTLTYNFELMRIAYSSTFANITCYDFRIYNRDINSIEAAEHHNGTFNNETGLVFHSPMELTPSGAATYEFEYGWDNYYGLKWLLQDATGTGSTLMLYKAGTQNVTYITNESGNPITGMTVRANEDELIDRLYITYANEPTNISAIINQSAVNVDTDSDGDDVPDAFEDANITVNKNQQGGECKWNHLWFGAFNIVNSTGYIYYTNLNNGSALVGTEIQTAGTQNMSMNTAGAGETYNFTVNSGTVDWLNVTSGLTSNHCNLKYSNGTFIENQAVSGGSVNFTTNLAIGTYWIESANISIELLSQTPSTIYKNSTGYINISYGVYHNSSGLNNTSVSFIYRNYDWDLSDSNHSIRPPTNDLASEWNFDGRILRGANRNETPGLNFENNATITGGDTYTWSGLDENHTRLTIVPVSSTYTIVNISGTVHDLMPQMWYLDRTDQQEASKTQLAIHKTQNVLIKFWNFEIYKGNYDFLGVGYTDTLLNSNPALWPSDANPVNFYYINSSYDPATGGDPITSGYAVYMGSLNASGWTDHVYSPHSNSNYVRGFIDNNYLHTVINTTNISYIYFTSNTESSKPYYINMTNVASSINVSFANTNTLWAGNTPPYTLQSYTPNVWFAFMKLNMSLDHRLWAADNNDLWSSSTMSRTNITQALFPPTTPTIDHFHFLGETDYDMDGVYYGNFSIGCGVSSDPDGGDVTHNLTLHYGNRTFVAIINNTFTDKDITHNGVYFDANFSSIPYYSQTENYTLRLIATDDESETVTVWMGVNFSLDGSPRIISYSPETPISSSEGKNQTFSITTNLIGNVTWYLDSVEVFNETDVNSSSYSNDNASLGSHNVTVITTNTNGSNSMMWNWNVRTKLWSLIEDSVAWGISVAQYLVSNIGIVIVTAFSLVCILILMMLIGAALSVTRIIYR